MIYKEIIKIFNQNFNKGVTIFQLFLMGSMILGVIDNNQNLVIFSMVVCIFGYFEPNQDRFNLNWRTNLLD
jgi:hypothetical protein